MSRCLVTGADGDLGAALGERLRERGHTVIETGRREGAASFLDLRRVADWTVPDVDFAWLMAGITSLAECERSPERTRGVNVKANVYLATRLTSRGGFVVFPSTNVVFDGTKPFVPADSPVAPMIEYGRQKAAVEREILSLGGGILRLTKVWHGEVPLLRHWRAQLAAGMPVSAFHDMVMAPVTLEAATDALIWMGLGRRAGVHQLSASRDLPYAEAARVLMKAIAGSDSLLVECSWRDDPTVTIPPPCHTTLAATPPFEQRDPLYALGRSIRT